MTTESTVDLESASGLANAPFGRVCAMTELDSTTPEVGRFAGAIDPIWTIGPKVHGGTMVASSAAAATEWLRRTAPDHAAMFPISASTDFLGAPDPGEVSYEVRTRKLGRQIGLVDASLIQNGRTLVHTAFTFSHLDDSDPHYADDHAGDMPAEPPADALAYDERNPMGKLVHVARGSSVAIDPKWARFLSGEKSDPRLRLWIRPLEGDEADPDVSAFFAMMSADMSPPVPMNLGHFGWAPTVQMTTYLRRRPASGWLRVIARAREVGHRMFDEDQLVIDSTGAIVAQSRQLALIPTRLSEPSARG
ncbi:thioesterase family protein [Nocardia seriolae]|uniref:thioesterase family protein n=1 Tax=Nocardia seriolae TaxID=37332 RepID=UPI0009F95F5F|nr:thioesterase family protein [Nocardia seriolae]PSK27781.1 thioesterase family protein [Nocardia seriolae]QOW32701.1 thioesterase family protein [Nocardia seriolae]QUN20309.1 thioesterase family protein [Nocardia seriolae]WNJ59819.1 thioesterase family protein [Nocardia seriolae]